MASVIVLSLGPVQDFIATARKCQDLWFGSYLLSDLSQAVAEAVEAASGSVEGLGLVVPGDFKDGAVANEVIALVDDPVAAAAAATDALNTRLESWMSLFDRVPAVGQGGYLIREVAEAQVRDLIELIWAAAPIQGGGAAEAFAYSAARDRAKRHLASRKATRVWERVDLPAHLSGDKHSEPVDGRRYEGSVPKSTLDGARASVIHEKAYKRMDPERLRQIYKAKSGERLSGIDLLKRLGEEDKEGLPHNTRRRPAFHSTCHISSAALRQRLHRLAPDRLREWHDHLKADGVQIDRYHLKADGEYDGYLLYEGRLDDLYSEHRSSDEKGTAELVERSRKMLRGVLKDAGLSLPPMPYYAYLLADGDRMGAFISSYCRSEGQHRRFSEVLEGWASGCRSLVEAHQGSCVYAGGDDVMALVPLHSALELSRKLRDSFVAAMEGLIEELPKLGPSFEELKLTSPAAPTLSVGLAIAHNIQPMSEVLDLARYAETRAKDAGRDALAVAWKKRSGGTVEVAKPWRKVLDRSLERWAMLFGGDLLPDKAAFVFEEALAPFDPDSPPSAKLMESLLLRALERRRAGAGEMKLKDDEEKALKEALAVEDPNDGKALIEQVKALSAELQLARLFHDAFAEVLK